MSSLGNGSQSSLGGTLGQTQDRAGGFRVISGKGNHVFLYPDPNLYTNSCLTQTGSELSYYIPIQQWHRLVKVRVVHLTSAYVEAITDMAIRLLVEQGRSVVSRKDIDVIFEKYNIQKSTWRWMKKGGGVGHEYEPRTYTLKLKAANTDLIIPTIYLQRLP